MRTAREARQHRGRFHSGRDGLPRASHRPEQTRVSTPRINSPPVDRRARATHLRPAFNKTSSRTDNQGSVASSDWRQRGDGIRTRAAYPQVASGACADAARSTPTPAAGGPSAASLSAITTVHWLSARRACGRGQRRHCETSLVTRPGSRTPRIRAPASC